MEVALQMSSERWGVQDSPRQAWDVFQVLKGQVYKHQLQYLAGDSGPEPGFSTLWWENRYHFISLLPVPPWKQLPECSTFGQATPAPLPPTVLDRNEREAAKIFLRGSGNWYLLWEPFSFSPPSQGCNAIAWGFPQKATLGPGRRRYSGPYCSFLAKKVPDEVYEVRDAEARHLQEGFCSSWILLPEKAT